MKTPARATRHRRVRSIVNGSAERPRLVVFRGAQSLSAQLVDDQARNVMVTVRAAGANQAAAKQLGAALAKQAKSKKVTTVVFDRAGYAYHGVVQTIAESAREGGLKV